MQAHEATRLLQPPGQRDCGLGERSLSAVASWFWYRVEWSRIGSTCDHDVMLRSLFGIES